MPSSTPSPRRTLSKLRRNRSPNNTSSSSLANSTADDSSEAGGLRASLDAAVGKVKERTRKSSISDRRGSGESTGRRLTTLLSRRQKSPKPDSLTLERNLSVQSSYSDNGSVLSIPGNKSDSSLPDDSGRSSLLTDDGSDVDRRPTRPTLSPHQSHAGYLTLSSPELNARTTTVTTEESPSISSGILAANGSSTSIPHIVEPTSDTLQAAPFPKRGSSPVGDRLRGAFNLSQKQLAGDSNSANSAGSAGGGLGRLFRPKSRTGSINTQEPDAAVSADEKELESGVGQEQGEPTEEEERPETPRQRGRTRINTTSLPATPPNLNTTPTTVVTPPTPTIPDYDTSTFPTKSSITSASRASPPKLSSVESIRHRRAQSGSLPSKLSNSTTAPLTPTIEEVKTAGGTLTQPTSATGFFTSFMSAAQKAADQLSTNINTISVPGKGKPTSPLLQENGGGEDISALGTQQEETYESGSKQQPAINTLGKGDLSLSALGITENRDPSPMSSTITLPQQDTVTGKERSNGKADEEAAANRAVSMAYEKPVQSAVSQAMGVARPPSVMSNDRLTLGGDMSPPRSGADGEGLKRSGSVRSVLSGRRRKHRASSATNGTQATGSAIAAAIKSSANAIANPSIGGASHRLTGFAVASNKRNKDFHQLFRSVPEDDYLIEDYSAALQRDILLHGRIYISEGHVCFSSNILGWVTNLVISFDEVVSVEKRNTAIIFPNAIVIQTLQARNTFASLATRDSTYDLLIGIWKTSHPNLKSSLNGVTLDDGGTSDKTELAEPEASDDDDTADGSDDDVYDEDDDEDAGSFNDAGTLISAAGSENVDAPLSRKTSAIPVGGAAPTTNGASAKGLDGTEAIVTGAAVSAEFPGATTHTPTECAEAAEHYDRPLTDVLIPAPLGKVYSLAFGPASGIFMRKLFDNELRCKELNLVDDGIGLDNDHKTMTFDYIKPLNAPVGPRQTKCITTNNLLAYDLEKAVTVDCSTQTPDVPSGSVFTTKTRYCFMWGPDNSTRMIASCTIEWTGKSWLKGPIESGANNGQVEYVKFLTAALKAAVTTKLPVRGSAAAVAPRKGGKRKGKKEVSSAGSGGAVAQREAAPVAQSPPSNWGPLEPVHQILDAVGSLLGPLASSQAVIAVLGVLLLYTWLFPQGRGRGGRGLSGYTAPERVAAYEEIWRQEESSLWEWLEDRVGLDGLAVPGLARQESGKQRKLNAKVMGDKLEEERLSQRQMDEAIKVTEERLQALKVAVAKKKQKGGAKAEL